MGKISQTIRGYIWWMYPRGSVHYDIMVTLILAFIFLGPIWINFRDKPQPRPLHQTEVLVKPDGNGFVYTVDAVALTPFDNSAFDGVVCASNAFGGAHAAFLLSHA